MLSRAPVSEGKCRAEADLHSGGVVQRQVAVDDVVRADSGRQVRPDRRVNLPESRNLKLWRMV